MSKYVCNDMMMYFWCTGVALVNSIYGCVCVYCLQFALTSCADENEVFSRKSST